MRKLLAKIYKNLPVIRELSQMRHFLWEIVHYQKFQQQMQAIRFFDFELSRVPRYQDPLRLHKYAHQVCSQNGEDGMIHEIFKRIGTTNKTFLEVGVGDGTQNNTIFLLTQKWKGFWIEGNSGVVSRFKKSNRTDLNDDHLKIEISFVSKENIVELFKKLNVPMEIDLLSLDIDLNTYHILVPLLEAGYKPRALVVEYNASFPADVEWICQYNANRTWDATMNYGASLKSFEILGNKYGYHLVGCDITGLNAFFVRSDLTENHFSSPYTSENHYEPPRYPFIIQRGHYPSIPD